MLAVHHARPSATERTPLLIRALYCIYLIFLGKERAWQRRKIDLPLCYGFAGVGGITTRNLVVLRSFFTVLSIRVLCGMGDVMTIQPVITRNVFAYDLSLQVYLYKFSMKCVSYSRMAGRKC